MDLFSNSISIAPAQKSDRLSRQQKTFNTLIGKIEKKRALLAGWESSIPLFQQRYAAKMQPLIEQAAMTRFEFVRRLDWAYQQKGISKTERHYIAGMISDLASEIASRSESADDCEAMKALYKKYSGGDFDAEEAESMEAMRSMVETDFGVDLGDDFDMSSPDAFIKLQQRLAEEADRQNAARQAKSEKQARRKKTAKQLAQEEKLCEEEQRMKLSLREIYRKLASALHPDRELDPEARLRKTALMQRVNQAYDNKDLLRLLELQLEIEHIDQTAINTMSEERLTYYNKILKDQLLDLEMEIDHVDTGFRLRFGIDPFTRLEPASLLRFLEADIVRARQEMRDLESDLAAAQAIGTLKTWLKAMRRRQRDEYFDDMPF